MSNISPNLVHSLDAKLTDEIRVAHSYELLMQCYLSGQISEQQWDEHLKDEVFKKWLIKNKYI